MKKTNKKGFTIVELVIVIAVIAILAAVLIPNISRLVKKANESADIQAVRNMNTFLAAESVTGNINSILDVYDLFTDSGYNVDSYSPLYSGRHFYYDKQYNQILYVDTETNQVLFPEERKNDTLTSLKEENHDLFSLSMEVPGMKAPQSGNYTKDASGNITATVENEKEYAYVINEYNTGDAKNLTLKIKGVIDLSGAQCMIREAKGDITIAGENGAVIKNVTVNTFVQVSSSNESREDAKYATSALISKVAGHAVTIKNIVLENANVKNVEAGGVGFLVGQSEMLGNTSGKVTIESVTIRNSTIVGHRNTGALVGFSVNNIEIVGDNKLENVKVMTVGGRSALLIGLVEKNATVSCTGTINYDSSCKLSVYNNSASEQKYADGALTECPTGWDESLFKGNFVKIEGQDQYIYSVKTTKNDGTKDYSIYGFKADALMLKKGNVDTDPLKAYTTVESIKSAN